MKKLLLSIGLVLGLTTVMNAQEWHFNSSDYLLKNTTGGVYESGVTLPAGDYEGLNGMTIFATADSKVKVETSKSIKDGAPSVIATIGALNTGGSGHGFILTNLPAGTKVTIALGASGAVDASKLRGLDIREITPAGESEVLKSFRCEGGDMAQFPRDFVYTMSQAGDLKATSEQGVVIYDVIAESSNALTPTELSKDVVSTEYFAITGTQIPQLQNGINIVKKTMSDGTVLTEKVILK